MSDKSASINDKKKKEPISGGQIAAIAVIAVIVVALVGTTVPLIGAKPNQENVFGTYNGVDITFAQDTVLYQTYVNLAQQNSDQMSNPQTQFQVWQQAYQQALVHEAFSQEAKKAGIKPSAKLINQKIIEDGVYNNTDGVFDETIYKSKTEGERNSVYRSYEQNYPYQTVINDLSSTLVSSDELSYISKKLSTGRSFEYVVVDYSAYPDDLATEYGKADPAQFKKMELSVLSTADESAINNAYTDLKNGETWDKTVETYSEDGYKTNKGALGVAINPWQLSANLADSKDLDKILALQKESWTEPIQGVYGWTIYRLDSDITDPDFTTADSIADVKRYLFTNNIDEVSPYIEQEATKVAEMASENFDNAATTNNLSVVKVSTTPNNIGNYSNMSSLRYTDTNGYLYTASLDEAVNKELFTSDDGYVSQPIKSNNNYIIVKCGEKNQDAQTESMLKTIYPYYAQSTPVNDAAYSVFTSPKLKDNFTAQMIKILGQTSTV